MSTPSEPLDPATARIAVVGPGSVGTFFAAQLAAAGRHVTACARRPFTEYVVESPEAPTRGPAHVVTDPARLTERDAPADLVLLCVKSHHTAGAAPWLERLCDDRSILVTVQNGTEGADRVAPFAHGAEVVPSVVYCGSELVAPGHVRHYARGILLVPDTPAARRVAPVFAGTAATWRPTPAYLTEAWRKLGINTVANGITALTRRRMDVLARPDVAEVARRLLHEAWAVAAAEGATLTAADADAFVDGLARLPGEGGTSMLYDRLAGRATEHDALYGAVVRAGRRHGIPTPTQETIHALVAAGDPMD